MKENISTYLIERFSAWCGRNGRIMKYWLGSMIHDDVNVVWSLPAETVAVISIDGVSIVSKFRRIDKTLNHSSV